MNRLKALKDRAAKYAHLNTRWRWGPFVVWSLIVGLVVGLRVINNNLFNQMNQWTVLFQETYRNFANVNCDRNAGVGCTSTVAVSTPQQQISGSTLFLFVYFPPAVALGLHATFYQWKEYKDKKAEMEWTVNILRDWVVFTCFLVAELCLLAYIRAGLGDVSLYSTLNASGLWVTLNVSVQMYVLQTFRRTYDAIKLEAPAVVATKDDKMSTIVKTYTAVELALFYITLATPFCLFWASFFLPLSRSWTTLRWSYVQAALTFFFFQLVEWGVIGGTLAFKMKFTDKQDKNKEFMSVVFNFYFSIIVIYMIKMFTSSFVLLYADANTGNNIPFLL